LIEMLRHACTLFFTTLLVIGSRPERASCETICDATGLAIVAVEEDRLRVVEPKVGNLHRDDVLLQLNSHHLRACADLEAAVGEARRDGLELMALLLRGDSRRTEWIQGWREDAKAAAPVRTIQPSFTPTPHTTAPTATAAPPVPAVADADAAGVEISRQLELGRELQGALPVTSGGRWTRRVDEMLAARRTPAPLEGLDEIYSYYATIGEILAYRDKTTRQLGAGRNRAGLNLEYGVDSEVTGWLERYPFLSGSVSRSYDPTRSFMSGQRMGLWSPDEAVRLLVERALSDGEKLDAELQTSAPSP
jgi:hypothetical protein